MKKKTHIPKTPTGKKIRNLKPRELFRLLCTGGKVAEHADAEIREREGITLPPETIIPYPYNMHGFGKIVPYPYNKTDLPGYDIQRFPDGSFKLCPRKKSEKKAS